MSDLTHSAPASLPSEIPLRLPCRRPGMLREAVEGIAMLDHDEIAWTITWCGDISYRHHILESARSAGCTDSGGDRSEVSAVSVRQPSQSRPIPQHWRVHA